QVMLAQLIRNHPNFGDDAQGRMLVTLADGLGDLAPLAAKYGPAGDHPGFLAEPPRAELFTPAFAMVVRGRGNVVIRPGLRPGEGYSSHVVRPPAGEAILQLDFLEESSLRIEGLVPEPRAALTLEVHESPQRFASGARQPAPLGSSAVWDTPAWLLEHIVGAAAWQAFSPLFPEGRHLDYALGAISPAASLDWDDGFVTVDVVADLGPPPAPAYIWDLILDVAQVRLHDGGLAEGQANVRLALPLLPIGLDADGLIAQMRPVLQAQKDDMVRMMVGDVDALPSVATLWLDADATLRVEPGAPAVFASLDDLLAGVTPRQSIPLTDAPQMFWTRAADGTPVALEVGAWQGDRVVIGHAAVPLEEE
ncbi:MAG: hypothetical protein KC620_25245, partial [Myxococcales bacterium]|nr:hypothetical protein [Myxococcales bacterium]